MLNTRAASTALPLTVHPCIKARSNPKTFSPRDHFLEIPTADPAGNATNTGSCGKYPALELCKRAPHDDPAHPLNPLLNPEPRTYWRHNHPTKCFSPSTGDTRNSSGSANGEGDSGDSCFPRSTSRRIFEGCSSIVKLGSFNSVAKFFCWHPFCCRLHTRLLLNPQDTL